MSPASPAPAVALETPSAEADPRRLAAYYVASFAALGVFLPFWPRWLAARGVDGPALGLVAAVVPAMAIVSPVAVGWLADTFRLRGSLLRAACAVAAASFLAIALAGAGPLATGAGHQGVAFLVVATALFAIARSPMVLLADVLALESRGGTRGYGRLRRFGSLGFLLAATATSALVPLDHPFAVPGLVAAALAMALWASFGLPARATPLPRPERAGVLAFVRRPGVAAFLAASALLHAAHAAYDVTFSLHLRDLGLADRWVGAAWAIGVAAEIALFSRAGPILDRLGHEGLLLVASIGGALRWVVVAQVHEPALALLLQPLHAISFGCLWLGATGFVARRAPEGHLASAQGTFSAVSAVGHALGMFAWPIVHADAGGPTVFASAGAIAALAIAPTWWLRGRAASALSR